MDFETSSFDSNYKNEISPENMGDKIPLSDFGSSCHTYKVNLHGKWVVLKRIKQEYIGNTIIEKSFDKEFEIGFTLDHPHIVKYLNKGYDKEGNYIITEYIDGKTLREHFIMGTVFSKKQIDCILIQLFEPVSYLHKKSIFHLDIKPENILISDKTGNIKLIDFGFSYSDGQIPISSGTKNYTSPEQKLNPEKVNYKNDLYSLAIVAIELFTGNKETNDLTKLPSRFKKIIRQFLSTNSDNHFTIQDALEVLNKQKSNFLNYLLIGILCIGSLFYIAKNFNDGGKNAKANKALRSSNWKALPALPNGRSDGKVIYYNGKIYYLGGVGAVGGLSTNNAFEFDITTQTYSIKKQLHCPRAQIAAVELNGKIYTFGGWIGNDGTDTSEVYDISKNQWSYLKPLPKKLTATSACVVNNKIYILGSTLGVTNTFFYEFDPINESYKQKTIFNNSRSCACIIAYGEKIYAIGGSSYKNNNYFIHNDCDAYDIATDSWEQKSSFPIGITNGSAIILGNEIHYLGGTLKSNSVNDDDILSSHYIYNITKDVWRNGEDLPYKVFGNECVTINKSIYSFGGIEKLPNATGKSFILN